MRLAVLATLLLLTATVLVERASAISYEPEPAFCEPHKVHDFRAPLERMPKLHQPSKSGRIGFGPENLSLESGPSLLFGDGAVGFHLVLFQHKGIRLPWTATTTLVDVNRKGHPTGKPRRSVRQVGQVSPLHGDDFSFEVPDDPAFYRVTVVFRGASGQKLGKFSSYYRVLRSTQRTQLRLNASSYRRETTVFARVENFGDIQPVSYGVGYSIERLEGEAWLTAPESRGGVINLIAVYSPPGGTGRCSVFNIPGSTPPGRYRMVKQVQFLSWPSRKRIDETLAAEFDVLP